MNLQTQHHYEELRRRLGAQGDLEAKLSALRTYKREVARRIEADLVSGQEPLERAMAALTHLADAVLIATYDLAREELSHQYGLPRCKDNDGNFTTSEFAIIGMGKLGGLELHLNSDLDLIFVYSRNGETQGRKPISNREYFAKLAQRIISYLSLTTRDGFAYKVDTELRPSGNAGTLVTSLDAWITYYHEHAAEWERQALLKARLIFAGSGFAKDFHGLFRRLVFLKPFPENLAEEVHRQRMRIEKELAKEGERRLHYKKGYGGLMDIEFAVQYLQLKLGKVFDTILSPNTLEALGRLEQRGILPKADAEDLRSAYVFYRMLEIYLEAEFELKEGYLDPGHECMADLAKRMSFASPEELLRAFSGHRRRVREVYLKTLKIQEN